VALYIADGKGNLILTEVTQVIKVATNVAAHAVFNNHPAAVTLGQVMDQQGFLHGSRQFQIDFPMWVGFI
jgi:hypothetical protein